MMMQIGYYLTCCLVFISLSISCGSSDFRVTEIQKNLDSFYKDGRLNGNVLIYEKGEIIYNESFGYSSYEDEIRLTSESIFNIASISKVYTAVAIMQLVENENLSLDDEIIRFFPNCPYPKIKVIHLLTHTSGLVRVQSQPFRNSIEGQGLETGEMIHQLFTLSPEPNFPPGSDYYYSNTNYYILARLVELLSGHSFADYVNINVLQKLKLTNTFVGQHNIPEKMRHNIAEGHSRNGWLDDHFVNVRSLSSYTSDSLTFSNAYGASSIYCTAMDLLSFHRSLQSGELLSKESLELMYTAFELNNSSDYLVDEKSNYPSKRGLSWCISEENFSVVYHAGGLLGGRSFFIRNLKEDQVVIVLTNNTELGRYDFTFPMRALNKEEYKLNPISLARAFCGEYTRNGVESAINYYKSNKGNPSHSPFGAFDFEEIGEELKEINDYASLMEVYQLYTENFPDQYSWYLLAESQYLMKNYSLAKESVTRALEFDPDYEEARMLLNRLKNAKDE